MIIDQDRIWTKYRLASSQNTYAAHTKTETETKKHLLKSEQIMNSILLLLL